MPALNLTKELGPLLVITEINEKLTLNVGIKTSSLFSNSGSGSSTITISSSGIEITANEALGLYRAVRYDGFYVNPNLNDLSSYAGITTVALVIGEVGNVVRTGLISESSWTWVQNEAVFISTNGTLTQTPHMLPIRRIGWAISTTQINLDPFPIISGV